MDDRIDVETQLVKSLETIEIKITKDTESKENDVIPIASNKNEFYTNAKKYWGNIPATVNGMLGGLGYINSIDIHASSIFLRELKLNAKDNALDCGAGIGRVSKNLLMPIFSKVDLVEQDPIFAEKARDYCIAEVPSLATYPKRLGEIFNVGLQEFTPESCKYNLIWSQWVLGHLTDNDLLAFFQRIKSGLCAKGIFVIKENVTSSKKIETDVTDSSLTRPLSGYETLLKEAGFKIIRSVRQQCFPKGLYPVYMIACKPVTR